MINMRTHSHWPASVIRHYRLTRPPCAVCAEPIAYDSPRVTGDRVNKSTLAITHKIRPSEAKERSWSKDSINSLANSVACHVGCANAIGAGIGNRQRSKAYAAPPVTKSKIESRW